MCFITLKKCGQNKISLLFFHAKQSSRRRRRIFEFFTFLLHKKQQHIKRMGTNTPEFGFGQDDEDDDFDDDVWANVDAR